MSTGHLHLIGSTPSVSSQKKNHPLWGGFLLEQDTGVEPAFTAWEAVVLPIYESCIGKGIIAKGFGNINLFLSKASISPPDS